MVEVTQDSIRRKASTLRAALAAKEAELAASRRVIYLLQWSGARFHDAIRAIQRDCPPEIAARIDRALADNATPPEAVDPELAAELRAKVEKLRDALVDVLSWWPESSEMTSRAGREKGYAFAKSIQSARATLAETQPERTQP